MCTLCPSCLLRFEHSVCHGSLMTTKIKIKCTENSSRGHGVDCAQSSG